MGHRLHSAAEGLERDAVAIALLSDVRPSRRPLDKTCTNYRNGERTMTTQTNQPKVILITGASSGIGEATVRLLAAQGHQLVIGARRTERLAALAETIQASGGSVHYRALDVTSAADVNAFAQFALDTFGRIDVIVNNAGVMPLSPLSSLKVDEWNRM